MLGSLDELGPLPASPTYDQLVYERLRRAIVDGELAPGQDLKVAVVAQQLGVSRIPVMQACQRLVGEGFLQPNPRKRLVVMPVTEARAAEGLSVLDALECLVVEAACSCANEQALHEWERANSQLGATASAEAAAVANRQFHELMWGTAELPYVRELLQRVWDHLAPARVIASPLRNTPGSVSEHQRIIDAVRQRDVVAAQAAVRAHRQQTAERVRTVLRSRHETPD